MKIYKVQLEFNENISNVSFQFGKDARHELTHINASVDIHKDIEKVTVRCLKLT